MSQTEEMDILATSPLFSEMDDISMNQIIGILQSRMLDRGEILFRQGQSGDYLLIVTKGCLEVKYTRGSGREFTIDTASPGDVLGEMTCLDPAPRSATVVADQPSEIYTLNRTMFHSLYRNAPSIAGCILRGVIELVTRRSRRLEKQIIDYLAHFIAARDKAGTPTKSVVSEKRIDALKTVKGSVFTGRLDTDQIPVPKGFTSSDFDMLISAGTCMVYPDRAIICREGDQGSSCYIPLKGHLRVLKTVNGQDRLLALVPPGTLLGQMALVSNLPRSATLLTKGDSLVLVITRSDFNRLFNVSSQLGLKFQEQIAVAGIRQHRRILQRIDKIRKRDDFSKKEERITKPSKKQELDPQTDDIVLNLNQYLLRLQEWGITTESLRHVEIIRHDGEISQNELKARMQLRDNPPL
jgi:CRP-like cAMP-binding protein